MAIEFTQIWRRKWDYFRFRSNRPSRFDTIDLLAMLLGLIPAACIAALGAIIIAPLLTLLLIWLGFAIASFFFPCAALLLKNLMLGYLSNRASILDLLPADSLVVKLIDDILKNGNETALEKLAYLILEHKLDGEQVELVYNIFSSVKAKDPKAEIVRHYLLGLVFQAKNNVGFYKASRQKAKKHLNKAESIIKKHNFLKHTKLALDVTYAHARLLEKSGPNNGPNSPLYDPELASYFYQVLAKNNYWPAQYPLVVKDINSNPYNSQPYQNAVTTLQQMAYQGYVPAMLKLAQIYEGSNETLTVYYYSLAYPRPTYEVRAIERTLIRNVLETVMADTTKSLEKRCYAAAGLGRLANLFPDISIDTIWKVIVNSQHYDFEQKTQHFEEMLTLIKISNQTHSDYATARLHIAYAQYIIDLGENEIPAKYGKQKEIAKKHLKIANKILIQTNNPTTEAGIEEKSTTAIQLKKTMLSIITVNNKNTIIGSRFCKSAKGNSQACFNLAELLMCGFKNQVLYENTHNKHTEAEVISTLTPGEHQQLIILLLCHALKHPHIKEQVRQHLLYQLALFKNPDASLDSAKTIHSNDEILISIQELPMYIKQAQIMQNKQRDEIKSKIETKERDVIKLWEMALRNDAGSNTYNNLIATISEANREINALKEESEKLLKDNQALENISTSLKQEAKPKTIYQSSLFEYEKVMQCIREGLGTGNILIAETLMQQENDISYNALLDTLLEKLESWGRQKITKGSATPDQPTQEVEEKMIQEALQDDEELFARLLGIIQSALTEFTEVVNSNKMGIFFDKGNVYCHGSMGLLRAKRFVNECKNAKSIGDLVEKITETVGDYSQGRYHEFSFKMILMKKLKEHCKLDIDLTIWNKRGAKKCVLDFNQSLQASPIISPSTTPTGHEKNGQHLGVQLA